MGYFVFSIDFRPEFNSNSIRIGYEKTVQHDSAILRCVVYTLDIDNRDLQVPWSQTTERKRNLLKITRKQRGQKRKRKQN